VTRGEKRTGVYSVYTYHSHQISVEYTVDGNAMRDGIVGPIWLPKLGDRKLANVAVSSQSR
jgi:hypothetical protein